MRVVSIAFFIGFMMPVVPARSDPVPFHRGQLGDTTAGPGRGWPRGLIEQAGSTLSFDPTSRPAATDAGLLLPERRDAPPVGVARENDLAVWPDPLAPVMRIGDSEPLAGLLRAGGEVAPDDPRERSLASEAAGAARPVLREEPPGDAAAPLRAGVLLTMLAILVMLWLKEELGERVERRPRWFPALKSRHGAKAK